MSLKSDVFRLISADQHGAYRLAVDPDSTCGQQPHTGFSRASFTTTRLTFPRPRKPGTLTSMIPRINARRGSHAGDRGTRPLAYDGSGPANAIQKMA